MPAQHQNGVHKAHGDGVLENTFDDTFLFTSESVGEGHPGMLPSECNVVPRPIIVPYGDPILVV